MHETNYLSPAVALTTTTRKHFDRDKKFDTNLFSSATTSEKFLPKQEV